MALAALRLLQGHKGILPSNRYDITWSHAETCIQQNHCSDWDTTFSNNSSRTKFKNYGATSFHNGQQLSTMSRSKPAIAKGRLRLRTPLIWVRAGLAGPSVTLSGHASSRRFYILVLNGKNFIYYIIRDYVPL